MEKTRQLKLGPYRLDALLGRGGMGEVYKAWDERLQRWVAIKHLLDESDPIARSRFKREARSAAQLGHPAIVQVFDVLETSDGDWIVMEFIDGPTLSEFLRDGPIDVGLVLDYGRQVAAGLAAAHEKGIVHRDLKAQNVMVLASGATSSGHLKILDFGLARSLDLGDDSTTLSSPNHILGTPSSMSPEQAQGQQIDARSDLFSLGVLLYELLTACSPFKARTARDTLARVLVHRQPPVRNFDRRIPKELSDLVDHLLEKDPAHRPAGADAVAKALERIAAGTWQSSVEVRSAEIDPAEIETWTTTARTAEAVVKTVLVSDLVDSTRLVEELGDREAAELFRRHDRLARDLLAERGGLEIDKSDGFLMLFDRPWNAVSYALAYHEALRRLAMESGSELTSRVGIHLGEVILRNNAPEDVSRGAKPLEVEGLAKPTAARLMALAAGGQTLLTRAAYDVARRAAVSEQQHDIQWLPAGRHRFKGIPDTIKVFEVRPQRSLSFQASQGSKRGKFVVEADDDSKEWEKEPRELLPSERSPGRHLSSRSPAETRDALAEEVAARAARPSTQTASEVIHRLARPVLYFGATMGFIASYAFLNSKLGIEGGSFNLFVAGLPLFLTALVDGLSVILRKRHEKRLIDRSLHGTIKDPGYFRLIPYEEGDRYERPDNAHREIYQWIQKADSPLLYLTGRSGVGKTSIIHSWVVPKSRASSPPFYPVVIRGFRDPIQEIFRKLQDGSIICAEELSAETDLRMLLKEASRRVHPVRILILLDQFEELIVLHGTEKRQRACEFLLSLVERPVPGLKVVIILRSDYVGMLPELGLPPLRQLRNWREISPFSLGVAKEFLLRSGLRVGSRFLDEILLEASTVDGTKGLIRPIILNMLGIVLARHAGLEGSISAITSEPGALIRSYLEEAANHPDVRKFAPAILRTMISDAGTKRPASIEELAQETKFQPPAIRGCLLTLENQGLARLIDQDTETWEISHDFVSRIYDRVLPREQRTLFRKVGIWVAPTSLALWILAAFAVLPFYRQKVELRAIRGLSDLGVLTVPIDGGYRVFLDESFNVSELPEVWKFLHLLYRIQELDISGIDQLNDLQPIQELVELKQLSLVELADVSNLDPLRELINLRRLTLSRLSQVSELAPLGELTDLRELDLSYLSKVSELETLRKLVKLQELRLAELHQVSNLDPLRNLEQLENLTISHLDRVSREEVSAIQAILPNLRIRHSIDAEPTATLPGTQRDRAPVGVTDTAMDSLTVSATAESSSAQPLSTDFELIRRPQKIFGSLPEYTEEAREAGIQGWVIAKVRLSKTGEVDKIEVLKGLPLGLSEAAVRTVSTWKYEPATLYGEPVEVYHHIAIPFRLPVDE